MNKINEFEHATSLNCETGVMRNLLHNKGMQISEDMIFGIGSGLYFIHFPFIKMGTVEPLTSFRYTPGSIIKNASKLLDIDITVKTFKNTEDAMQGLDEKIENGTVVGITGDLYYFEVFPEFLSFHFNNHNLAVYGKTDDQYLVSDPIVENVLTIPEENMKKARFVKAPDNPKGKMYWVNQIHNKNPDLRQAVHKGLKKTCKRMLNPYFPFGGIKGMRLLAKALEKYPAKRSRHYAEKHLVNMIRHQEFVGGGGSGYRKQFGKFLLESGELLNNPVYSEYGKEMMDIIVPEWRGFAIDMARCSRKPVDTIPEAYHDLAARLRKIAGMEHHYFDRLSKAIQ